MYLMDRLAAMAAKVKAIGQATHPVLGPYCDLHGRMTGAPRFLLDRNAAAAAVELSLGRPKIILEALAHLHIPYRVLWVEWEEAHREKLRVSLHDQFGLKREAPGRPLPERLGFLVEADGNGRKGTMTWMWSFKTGQSTSDPAKAIVNEDDPCELGIVSPYFDLDDRIEQGSSWVNSFLAGNIGRLWADNEVQKQALIGIWETASHKLSDWGERYLTQVATENRLDQERLVKVIENAYADVYGEWISALAVLLLLTASRPIVEYRPIDRSKLNKTRIKTRKTPLLDHTEVILHIGERTVSGQPRGPLGHARKSPRIHMVSRYLARRGTKHWIVQPYLRGSGEVVDRHVHVRK